MWEPDEVPSEGQWSELTRILGEHSAKWMLWESEPAQKTVERLRELGVQSAIFNPCANRPSKGDFLTVMTENAGNLRRIFGQVPSDR